MSKVHDLFGYQLEDRGEDAESCRKRTWCRFRNDLCDGGGNRYLSQAELNAVTDVDLIRYFNGKIKVQAGVCSLDAGKQGKWIVCPRRLFAFKKSEAPLTLTDLRGHEKKILDLAKLEPGKYGVWKEVKIKYSSSDKKIKKTFDYTFDYVVVRLESRTTTEAARLFTGPIAQRPGGYKKAGYDVVDDLVQNLPVGNPLIIEIMTCSTSGGNKAKGTTVTQAFKAAVRHQDHVGPGINYRQVWARMASQLIVKSEVALEWGGKTVWVVQDKLAEYIRSTTALDLKRLASTSLNEVNMAACGYGDSPHELELKNFYAGTIESAGHAESAEPYFLEIIKAPVVPPLSALYNLLLRSRPDSVLVVHQES